MSDKDIREKMESLTPLSGGIVFGKEEAWDKLQARIERKPARRILLSYRMAAAAALLLFVSLLAMYNYPSKQLSQTNAISDNGVVAQRQITPVQETVAAPAQPNQPASENNINSNTQNKQLVTAKNNKAHGRHNLDEVSNYYKTMEFICNGKPCPTEICAIKKIKCQNDQPQAISSTAILESGVSGQIPDKSFDNVETNAPITIEALKIKTGTDAEAVILNANSAPAYCVEKIANKQNRN